MTMASAPDSTPKPSTPKPRIPKLSIDPQVVREARRLASQAGQPIVEMARAHTTVSV